MGEITASSPTTTREPRLCWICFGTEQDDPDNVWVTPCQCRGTMRNVHEACLQNWIDEKQKRTNSCRVSCSQCKTHYILTYPPASRFIRIIERYDKFLNSSSPILAVSVVFGSIYWCCGSYGFISVIQVMGYEEGRRVIEDAEPLLLVIGLPVIPITLILAKLIKWEDFILRLWRNSTPKLPRPLSYLIEPPPAKPRVNCDQILLDPGFNDPIGCTRMICGALLLPTISALVGKVFFSTILPGSQWRRSLVGGLAFLFVKGLAKIYLRKSRFIRYSQRSINNYVPSSKTIHNQVSGDGEAGTSGGGGELPGSDSMVLPGSLSLGNDQAREVMEESDDEGGHPRALFSMTIRI